MGTPSHASLNCIQRREVVGGFVFAPPTHTKKKPVTSYKSMLLPPPPESQILTSTSLAVRLRQSSYVTLVE